MSNLKVDGFGQTGATAAEAIVYAALAVAKAKKVAT